MGRIRIFTEIEIKQRRMNQAKEKNVRIKKRNSNYINKYKMAHPCIDCGFSDMRALDFDHVRGIKSNNINKLRSSSSIEIIQIEIDKCEIRCANCHRIRTYNTYHPEYLKRE